VIAIAKLCILISIIYLIKVFLYPIYKPISLKQKKHSRMYMKSKKKDASNKKLIDFKKKIASKYIKRLISATEKKRFKKIIDRLDLSIKPEEIRFDQIFYTLCALVLTVFMLSANRLFGCCTAILIVLGWLYPISEMEKKIEKKNKNISLDFPSFYSMVYYQYSKSVNIYLADVIKDYLPNANMDMADELGVMLDNCEYGEGFALKQLKKRVPLHYIIKFCDIMETRLNGYDNISQMAYLKNDMDQFRIRALEDELVKRERSNGRIQLVLIAILIIYIIIYYLFMILTSLTMFQ
jgi:Flp pilus assembly protein TadB